MNSCLYECSVLHHRFTPCVHHFRHDLFMFYLDLDELDAVAWNIVLFGHNRTSVYNLCDQDHEPAGQRPLKERILDHLRHHGLDPGPQPRVMLLTLPRVLGYIFNPISVYYCFDAAGTPFAAVAEVGNTFLEMKLYLLQPADLGPDGTFAKIIPKHFYVSPFSPLDLNFDFRLPPPQEELNIQIDEFDGPDRVLLSTLTGRRAALTNRRLVWFTVNYPLVTLKVIALIHGHALRLWLKRIPFYRKAARPDLQQAVLRPPATLAAKSK